ncbi:hypothetical protein [Glycomyces xiaoerkulensis]|uniref:hypothetical protein n=1 Tax=Glycomyces xiaoerkulensis TaxID=2038139 RepID=UPI000C267C34|nr:hypothetical protein [Glycomyces xiaoerkulensis]
MSERSAHGEIRLEIEGDPAPEPEPRTRRLALPRVPNAALAAVTALLLVAATTVAVAKWQAGGRTTAEETVLEFLNAARDGEADRALELAGAESWDEPLLDPEALDGRWEIGTVSQVTFRDDGREAVVYAEIETRDGNRVGDRFTVDLDGPDPTVTDGIPGIDAGGVHQGVAFNGMEEPDGELSDLRLLPGRYEIGRATWWPFETSEDTALVLGDQIKLGSLRQLDYLPSAGLLTLSEEGREAVEAAVRDFLDACLETAQGSCPFVLPEGERLTRSGPWEIASYPSFGDRVTGIQFGRFELSTRYPGEIRVDVADEAAGTVTIACDLRLEGVSVNFFGEGVANLQWGAEPPCSAAVAVD